MISYMSVIQMKSLSLVVFEIFAKIAFLTFDLGQRPKVMAAKESPYMTSYIYMSVTQRISLYLVVFQMFAKIAFFTSDLGTMSKVMLPK